MSGKLWRLGAALLLLGAAPADSPAGRFAAGEALAPPWQGGSNNDAIDKGLVFTVPPVDAMVDFHGSLDDPQLILYAAGNYYFAMRDLVRAFEATHPAYRGRVFYETLPPGLLAKQMAGGGTITSGNLTFTVKPDVMMTVLRASEQMVAGGKLVGPIVAFATNDLSIMVPRGNPAGIRSLTDLGRADLTLIMPNPTYEGVAAQIRASLVKAGGEALARQVYDTKVADGTTILTRIHHRQTPLALLQGVAQAGVTWTSEAIFQERQGHGIAHVPIPEAQNTRAIYSAAMARGAAHAAAARAWLDFLGSDTAFATLAPYGFIRFEK